MSRMRDTSPITLGCVSSIRLRHAKAMQRVAFVAAIYTDIL